MPQLWQGPSPFEYRGLETESFEETPRRSPTAAPEQAQHAQQASGSPSMSPMPSKAPPLLRRNLQEAAEPQQAQATSEVIKPAKVGAPGLQFTSVSAAAFNKPSYGHCPLYPALQADTSMQAKSRAWERSKK